MNYRHQIILILLVFYLVFAITGCGFPPSVLNNRSNSLGTSPVKVGQIVFGENYEEVEASTNNNRPFKIINPHTTFKYDEPFAFIVMSEEPYGKTKIELVLSEVSDKGSEIVILRSTHNIADPAKHRNTANRFDTAEEILSGQKSGRYKLRCLREDTVLAEGEFIYQGNDNRY